MRLRTSAPVDGAPRRRKRVSSAVVIVAALGATGGLWAYLAPNGSADDTAAGTQKMVAEGRSLYLEGCSSCHGLQAQGSSYAPSLIGAGGAAVDFQVSTGRMPLTQEGPQAEKKDPAYSESQIQALDAYAQTLGQGPALPTYDLADGDLALGGELFRTDCAQCHNAAGAGGALSHGKYAPPLTSASDEQVMEAMLTGPESMPNFSGGQLSQHDYNSIVKYVAYLRHTNDPGGFAIGHLGPVPEGLVIWLVGIGGLMLAALWIGARR